MQIIQYVYFEKPGEKEQLDKLLETCESEGQLRKKIAETFQLDSIKTSVVVSRYRSKFIKILESKN